MLASPDFGSTGSPSFTTRDAETNAVVQDGDTLAIGGIIGERKTRDRSGVPYLMDLPVFGRFFGTTADIATRTELVILITPHVIRNKDESQFVTQDLKDKLSDVKNELERVARERAKSRHAGATAAIAGSKPVLSVRSAAAGAGQSAGWTANFVAAGGWQRHDVVQ